MFTFATRKAGLATRESKQRFLDPQGPQKASGFTVCHLARGNLIHCIPYLFGNMQRGSKISAEVFKGLTAGAASLPNIESCIVPNFATAASAVLTTLTSLMIQYLNSAHPYKKWSLITLKVK